MPAHPGVGRDLVSRVPVTPARRELIEAPVVAGGLERFEHRRIEAALGGSPGGDGELDHRERLGRDHHRRSRRIQATQLAVGPEPRPARLQVLEPSARSRGEISRSAEHEHPRGAAHARERRVRPRGCGRGSRHQLPPVTGGGGGGGGGGGAEVVGGVVAGGAVGAGGGRARPPGEPSGPARPGPARSCPAVRPQAPLRESRHSSPGRIPGSSRPAPRRPGWGRRSWGRRRLPDRARAAPRQAAVWCWWRPVRRRSAEPLPRPAGCSGAVQPRRGPRPSPTVAAAAATPDSVRADAAGWRRDRHRIRARAGERSRAARASRLGSAI